MIRLTASIRSTFTSAVGAASACIDQSGGWLESHTFYSNIMAVFALRCPREGVGVLQEALQSAGFVLHHPPVPPEGRSEEVPVHLTVTVLHDESDLRRPVPAFG